MPNFTYITNLPAASHNPSFDQPNMQINTNSTDNLIAQDHISFNAANGGYHKTIHQQPLLADPAAIPGAGQFYPKTLDGQINPYYQSGTGAKYNIVNKSGSGLVNITLAGAILPDIIPDNCIGFIVFTNPNYLIPGESIQSFRFSAFAGVLYTEISPLYNVQAATSIFLSSIGAPGSLQLTAIKNIQFPATPTTYGADIIGSAYRYILWPTL